MTYFCIFINKFEGTYGFMQIDHFQSSGVYWERVFQPNEIIFCDLNFQKMEFVKVLVFLKK